MTTRLELDGLWVGVEFSSRLSRKFAMELAGARLNRPPFGLVVVVLGNLLFDVPVDDVLSPLPLLELDEVQCAVPFGPLTTLPPELLSLLPGR